MIQDNDGGVKAKNARICNNCMHEFRRNVTGRPMTCPECGSNSVYLSVDWANANPQHPHAAVILRENVRPLWLVTVTIKAGRWAVYKDGKRISTYFEKGREALDHAIAQGWQVGYRGLTYNDGGYLHGVPASRTDVHFGQTEVR